MIENYCMKVVQFLNNKEEIKKEVEAMIYDMLEEKFGEKYRYSDDEISKVLKALGSPYILALKYTNLPKKIVSEKNIYKFYYIYGIILFVLAISFVFSVVFNAITARENFLLEFFSSVGGVVVTALVAFAILAIIFMLMEHYNKEITLEHNPTKRIPKTSQQIKKIKKKSKYSLAEQIFEIFFITAFLVFISFYMDKLYLSNHGVKILIFNQAYIKSYLWLINLLGVASIIMCIYRIISPKKKIIKEFVFYGFNILIAIIYSIILLNINLFTNPFIEYMQGFAFVQEMFEKYNQYIYQIPIMAVIAIVVVSTTIELIVNLHRIIVNRYDD